MPAARGSPLAAWALRPEAEAHLWRPPIQTAMPLFLVVLGGRSRGCHIEQHDVRFVAGDCIEDTLPQLRRQWFGLQRGLHIDSWQRIERVEGWRVVLRREPFNGPQRLWFVNVGAYDPDCPWELHAFGLFVAGGAAAAKAKAKRHLLVGAAQQHKDDSGAVESVAPAGPADGTAAPAPSRQPPLPGMPSAPAKTTRPTATESGTASRSHGSTDGQPAGTGAEPEDALALQRLGRWHVHLLPPEPDADSGWQPLRPDWFGYRRIDQPQSG